MVNQLRPGQDPKELVRTLTGYMMRKHYCENDVEALVALFDPEGFFWFGAAEQEFAVGPETVAGIFRQFAGKVPLCNLSQEEYHVMELAPGVYLCSGRVWIATDPSTQVYLRVHQRITTVFRFRGEVATCCHIHISNPYSEMAADDVGFPTQMAQQTYEYLQEQVQRQKRQIAAQTAELWRLSFEDSMTGMFNRNRFDLDAEQEKFREAPTLGVVCMDINGLKEVNDRQGHRAGDELIRRAARHVLAAFAGMAYRLGGDEFLVVCPGETESAFRQRVQGVRAVMELDGIQIAMGLSWRQEGCSVREQMDDADRDMYCDKSRYYAQTGQENHLRQALGQEDCG